MKSSWQTYLSIKKNRVNLFATLLFLICVLIILPSFLEFIEKREGISFTDPVLNLFNPIDITWLTFILIYAGLIVAIITLTKYPKYLILALKVYALTGLFRIGAMYLLPLNPPTTMIILNDPFVQFFGSGEILTKDLFFSGHTSTMFIMFLTAQTKITRSIFLTATLLIAVCVLAQHVHYTVDVFAAPFFTFTAFRSALWVENKFLW